MSGVDDHSLVSRGGIVGNQKRRCHPEFGAEWQQKVTEEDTPLDGNFHLISSVDSASNIVRNTVAVAVHTFATQQGVGLLGLPWRPSDQGYYAG